MSVDQVTMTEEELLVGITDALTIAGWTWMHILRSDHVTMGHAGFPDVVAAHPAQPFVLAWELKSQKGTISPEQWRWMQALGASRDVDVRVIRPADYDLALEVIVHGRQPRDVWPA